MILIIEIAIGVALGLWLWHGIQSPGAWRVVKIILLWILILGVGLIFLARELWYYSTPH
jgi:sterol desaturase/sphingolipid hydroxylase (fatty acid hydroxylase superfamily)